MHKTPRQFVDACGGYRKVAPRVGMKPTTLHTHLSAGLLPTKIFKACCDLAGEFQIAPPRFDLFSFIELEPVQPSEAAGESEAA